MSDKDRIIESELKGNIIDKREFLTYLGFNLSDDLIIEKVKIEANTYTIKEEKVVNGKPEIMWYHLEDGRKAFTFIYFSESEKEKESDLGFIK